MGDYGLELAGMEIVGQVEIDAYCQKILSLRWPHVPKWKDIKEVDSRDVLSKIGQPDIICGGFPCQPFSTAGRRAGTKDDRNLWPEMLRLIREIKPRWVLGENVPGLMSIDDGRVFGGILRDLAESGYVVEWDCISASALGAPHRRDRVWIVAHTKSRENRRVFTRGFQPDSGTSREMADTKIIGCERSRSSRNGRSGDPDRRSVCDAAVQRLPDWSGGAVGQPSPLTEFERSDGKELGDSKCVGPQGQSRRRSGKKSENGHLGNSKGKKGFREVERDFCGVPHVVSNRVERLKLLGNGQVSVVTRWLGERIMEFDNEKKTL